MSLSLIAFQPAIDEPSNMMPSLSMSSSIVLMCWAVCCHLPRGSVNRKSTYLTSFSLMRSITFLTFAIASSRVGGWSWPGRCARGPQSPRSSPKSSAKSAEFTRSGGRLQAPGRGRTGVLHRVAAALAGANSDDLLDRRHEDLAVADASGVGRLLDRLD